MQENIIVGGGLTGLMIANELQASSVVIEKSKGLGGRFATRRTDQGLFNHGAPEYPLNQSILKVHSQWMAQGLVEEVPPIDGVLSYRSRMGMTSLAQDLARNVKVQLNERVVSLKKTSDQNWEVLSDSGQKWHSKRIIITTPVPQALEILDRSHIPYSSAPKEIVYRKSIVILLVVQGQTLNIAQAALAGTPIERVSLRASTAQADMVLITIEMSEEFSETRFDEDDQIVLAEVSELLHQIESKFKFINSQVKKWRYSHPLNPMIKPFAMVCEVPLLILAGDAFGGGLIEGAAHSANEVLAFLQGRGTP